jgi:hypothetical protein
MIERVSVGKAGRRCGANTKTAFRWRHRLSASLAGASPKRWRASVYSEETFILGSFKGKRQDSATPVFWPRIDWLGGTLGCHLVAFLVVALCRQVWP